MTSKETTGGIRKAKMSRKQHKKGQTPLQKKEEAARAGGSQENVKKKKSAVRATRYVVFGNTMGTFLNNRSELMSKIFNGDEKEAFGENFGRPERAVQKRDGGQLYVLNELNEDAEDTDSPLPERKGDCVTVARRYRKPQKTIKVEEEDSEMSRRKREFEQLEDYSLCVSRGLPNDQWAHSAFNSTSLSALPINDKSSKLISQNVGEKNSSVSDDQSRRVPTLLPPGRSEDVTSTPIVSKTRSKIEATQGCEIFPTVEEVHKEELDVSAISSTVQCVREEVPLQDVIERLPSPSLFSKSHSRLPHIRRSTDLSEMAAAVGTEEVVPFRKAGRRLSCLWGQLPRERALIQRKHSIIAEQTASSEDCSVNLIEKPVISTSGRIADGTDKLLVRSSEEDLFDISGTADEALYKSRRDSEIHVDELSQSRNVTGGSELPDDKEQLQSSQPELKCGQTDSAFEIANDSPFLMAADLADEIAEKIADENTDNAFCQNKAVRVSVISDVSANGRNFSRMSLADGQVPYYLDSAECSLLNQSPLDVLLSVCNQESVFSWPHILPELVINTLVKIGEGTYAEVFRVTRDGCSIALKVIPIDGTEEVNGEKQKSSEEILPEVLIAQALSELGSDPRYATPNFVRLLNSTVVSGRYPKKLLDEWAEFDKEKGSENDDPQMFSDSQTFIIFEFSYGGCSLEEFAFSKQEQATAVLMQTLLSLSVAEQSMEFEHRDLHWGNVLVAHTDDQLLSYTFDGRTVEIPSKGVKVCIIDFTYSRMRKGGVTIFTDMSVEPELFEGPDNEFQFEIYRMMQRFNNNSWKHFEPKSNVFWLQYLVDKMVKTKKYGQRRMSKKGRNAFNLFSRRLHDKYGSCMDALCAEDELLSDFNFISMENMA